MFIQDTFRAICCTMEPSPTTKYLAAISRAAAFAVTDLPFQEQEGWKRSLSCSTLLQNHQATLPTILPASCYKSEPPHSSLPSHPARLRWHLLFAMLSKKGGVGALPSPSCRNTDFPNPPLHVPSRAVKRISRESGRHSNTPDALLDSFPLLLA